MRSDCGGGAKRCEQEKQRGDAYNELGDIHYAPQMCVTWLVFKIIELFRERLSDKVRATIPKGIVGDFEFKNLKEWHEQPWRYVCEC